jgi:hypothetical protein
MPKHASRKSTSKRGKARSPVPFASARQLDLIGCNEAGEMRIWDTGYVEPVSRFQNYADGCVHSAYYVIQWRGHAVTVHCGSNHDHSVCVLFMCGGGYSLDMSSADAEAMLLGRVVPGKVQPGTSLNASNAAPLWR